MKYYLHDANSFHDEKIYSLYMEYGYEGLGLFYTFLEKIAQQEKPINENVIIKQLNIGKKLSKVWDFMKEIELVSSKNGDCFNDNLLNFAESYQIKKEKTRIKVSEWRKNQRDSETVTSYVPVSNPPKVKESKVKENKDINIEFDIFWNLYDKKVDSKKCKPKWDALDDKERIAIMSYIPKYKQSIEDKKFRRHPATFLNNRTWENELIYEEDSKPIRPKGYQQWLDGRIHTPEKQVMYQEYLSKFVSPIHKDANQIGKKT